MKRITALLVCFIFVFLTVSCSASPETVPEYIGSNREDDIDLGGATYVYGMVRDYFFEGEDSTLSYINNTELGDLAVKRMKDVENNYNCRIEFSYGSGAVTAFNYAVAGTYIYDILSDESYDLCKFITNGVYIDLTGLDNINPFDSVKWGNKMMLMSMMYDGGLYGVLPAQHPMRLSNSLENIIAVNEDYITDLAVTDPRDYFENGIWNWTNFEECLRTFAHTGVVSNEYIYSFSALFLRFSQELGTSNGTKLYVVNDDGSITHGYFSSTAIDAYNQAYDWFYGSLSDNILEEGGNDPDLSDFTEGRAVMSLIDAYMVLSKSTSFAYKMENFGIIPVPYGPSASGPNDYTASYRAADFTLSIPVTAKDYETSALLIDAIYEPFEGYETREKVIDYLARNYFKDERDARFFIEMTDEEHVYYHDHLHHADMFYQFGSTGITRGVEKYKDQYIEIINKYDKSMYQTLDELSKYFDQ